MTPLIAKMASQVWRVAERYQWFEFQIDDICRQTHVSAEMVARPLPFPKMAIVFYLGEDPFLLLLNQKEEKTTCACLCLVKNKLMEIDPFIYAPSPEGGVLVTHLNGTAFHPGNTICSCIVWVSSFLSSLEKQPVTAYIPTKRANQAKRIRQNKAPFYDWNTIVIEPPQPKALPQGGTHASPRWHERRGHWRNIKNNKRVWVRNCQVGDRAKGAIFHDYVVKGATCTRQD